MKKYIVTTTIFKPSDALYKFASIDEWKLIVVGDKKTPHEDYNNMDNIIYMNPDYQEEKYSELSDLIGWNCIQRRNLGYIEAYNLGADVIASIDDDNIPYDNWGKELFLNKETICSKYHNIDSNIKIWDPISTTKYKYLWHRGFPLDLIKYKNNISSNFEKIIPSVQADFWDGDPDVDAIERLIYNLNCSFTDDKFPFCGEGISPFNSQNTFFTRETMKDFFLFPFVGRMDDIWGSYYYQSKGHKVIYNKPSVYQERNIHNYITDFSKEVDGYINNKNLIESVIKNSDNIKDFIPKRSWDAFEEYKKYFHDC
jgi:hypothetical protein